MATPSLSVRQTPTLPGEDTYFILAAYCTWFGEGCQPPVAKGRGFLVCPYSLFCRLRRHGRERGCEDTSRSSRRASCPPAPPAFPSSRVNQKAPVNQKALPMSPRKLAVNSRVRRSASRGSTSSWQHIVTQQLAWHRLNLASFTLNIVLTIASTPMTNLDFPLLMNRLEIRLFY